MAINMEEQFKKLVNIVGKVSRLSLGLKDEYLGPVNPTSILSFGSKVFTINVLVLAESVPAQHFPYDFDAAHLEAVTVYLDDNFNFKYYHPQVNELAGLSLLVGDKEFSYDGTVEGAAEFFRKNNWHLTVLYKDKGVHPTI
jgi:hypothetical protein